MRPIATGRVAWSVFVGHTDKPCKNGQQIKMQFGGVDFVGPRNDVFDGDAIGITW